jgi:hypothetical protein
MKITVTEALAEVPTIVKRIGKKQQFIMAYLYRQSVVRDPHEKDGGSAELIKRELQAISDLQNRLIAIRAAIQKSNQDNSITIGSETKTIADWLTWRREIADEQRRFYNTISSKLQQMRQEAMRQGLNVSENDAGFSPDYIVNVNEKELAESIEDIENTLGVLDGQLSLKNATLYIEVL